MSSTSEARDTAGGRLGGARADFVASLGRKVSDARELLNALEDDPTSRSARDELRRRLHALGSGARLLRFEAMARSLQEVLGVLDRSSQGGGLRDEDVAFLAQVLDDLPALAWGEPPPRDAAPSVVAEESVDGGAALAPVSVLVVGDEALADALTEDAVVRSRAFECERTEDMDAALEVARAYAPDLVLIDGDRERAGVLVEALLDDPLTEPVPVVVVGTFRTPDDGARFVALGVAKTLARPVTPDMVRQACDEVLAAREGRTVRMTLGEPTLEQLAERLAGEVKSALVDSLDPTARSWRVPLGEGTEVLGAIWGAIARVQEIVSQRTKGAIKFGGDAPEGAIALAPWLHQDLPSADRAARGRGAGADVRLQGRRVVVADDNPGVTWFISDLLRTAGCEVHEALDGLTALNLAYRVQPELVVSDILMPGLDGFALCRALRRDIALRDTPVMLLSWKEDLLQRVRELGASAAAYMRKESDSRAVLARVREVLRPRARIEMRLRGDGEVRGRLDDLTPRLLLELVGAIRKNARVGVRDASFLYEIEIRDGAPRKATRTASDGGLQSGTRALAMLLAVGAGRFVVSSSTETIRGELSGTLFEQLAKPVAAARGALAATTGPRIMEVERMVLDEPVLEEYLRATPDPARELLRKLGAGASPRKLLLAGEATPSLLEDLLCDLAGRCAIRAVHTAEGKDLLTPAVEAALAVLTGATPPERSLPPNARPSVAPRPPGLGGRQPEPSAPAAPPRTEPAGPAARAGDPARKPASAPARVFPPSAPVPSISSMSTGAFDSAPAPSTSPAQATGTSRPSPRPPAPFLPSNPPPPSSGRLPDDDGPPSSLEDAVMREISDRSPDPGAVLGGFNRPPIVDTRQLRPRSSNPPADHEDPFEGMFEAKPAEAKDAKPAPVKEAKPAPVPALEAKAAPIDEGPLPSIPPDAVVPAANSNDELAVAPAVPGEGAPSGDEAGDPASEMRSSEKRLVAREPAAAASPEGAGEPAEPAPIAITSLPPEDLHEVDEASAPLELVQRREVRTAPPAAPAKRSRWGLVVAFALLGGAVVLVLRVAGLEDARPAPSPAPSAAAAAPSPPPAVVPAPPPSAATAASTAPVAPPSSDDLPPGTSVPPGFGVLEESWRRRTRASASTATTRAPAPCRRACCAAATTRFASTRTGATRST